MNKYPVDPIPCQPNGPVPRQTSVQFAARLLLLLVFVAVPVLGCSGDVKGVKITGEVIVPDNMVLSDKDYLTVHIQSAVEGKSVGDAAAVGKDRTFKFVGPTKTGVPAGEYKVTVTASIYDHSTENAKHMKELKEALAPFKGKLDVGSSDMAIVIDLKKKTLTTK